jgi:hypothetical protein
MSTGTLPSAGISSRMLSLPLASQKFVQIGIICLGSVDHRHNFLKLEPARQSKILPL